MNELLTKLMPVRPTTIFLLLLTGGLLLISCNQTEEGEAVAEGESADGTTLFQALSPEQSGIEFANDLTFDRDFNIYTYRNYYNGGGVALGDVNGDGLTDLYFSGNMVPNRLYLNRGNMQFEDVTDAAGVAGKAGWSTGVTMADVNGDGRLDIYVCHSGDVKGDDKANELFINRGDGTFSEEAAAYGIADGGLSTHGVFFDYDRDGDLDLYLLNNSYQAIGSFNLQRNERPKRDPVGGDKLYRNDAGKFTDVSAAAGIYGSVIGFGLGVTVGDVNRDGWPDIYVSNDFFERDYLYLNQQDGTFKEDLPAAMKSISAASMGADLADINNDGYGDIFVTEMLPATNARLKTNSTFENWNRYQYNLQNDYYHQFTRNMLQRNNGDGTFSEIGRMDGVEATDWSWGALIFDMDNDGYKDLFVANGIFQDLTDRDFLDFIADDENKRIIVSGRDGVDFKKLVDVIPSKPVPNHAFHNRGPAGNYGYEPVAEAWGLAKVGFSNGSAYGDLDNDGDLDLVVNNVNATADIFVNHSTEQLPDRAWLQVELRGPAPNTFAVGAKVTARRGGQQYYLEHMPMRGFQSSIDYRLHFGLGSGREAVDSLVVEWPDGTASIYKDVAVNQLLKLDARTAEKTPLEPLRPQTAPFRFTAASAAGMGIDYVHRENKFSDFDRDGLLYHMLSAEGPRLCAGDMNGDGKQDFYIGGSKDAAGALYLSRGNGYEQIKGAFPASDAAAEDAGCACFDADGDGELDLYVAGGGSEFGREQAALIDRLYLNEGGGRRWRKSEQPLPGSSFAATSCVRAGDFDGDGDEDLFVGGRLRPLLYGVPTDSYILENQGNGKLRNVTNSRAPALKDIGLVTDAAWADVDGDGDQDLLIVGEWLAPRLLLNEGGKLVDATEEWSNPAWTGWYNRIAAGDLDGDGDIDFVLANHGLNSRFRADSLHPVTMVTNDFDRNGTAEQIVSVYEGERSYPLVLMHDLMKQIPSLRKKYLKYESFVDQTTADIFSPEQLANAVTMEARELRSVILVNEGDRFRLLPLPAAAQEAPLYGLNLADLDDDGDLDILGGGNFYYAKPEVGRYDASYGLSLLNEGNLNFRVVKPAVGGWRIDGEVRDIMRLTRTEWLVSRNDAAPVVLRRD